MIKTNSSLMNFVLRTFNGKVKGGECTESVRGLAYQMIDKDE